MNIEEQPVQDQPAETPAEAESGGEAETNKGAEATQSEQADNGLGVEGLPKELEAKEKELMRAFHAKTQALAEKERTLLGETEKYKQDANVLYDLAKQEWFKNAIAGEKARRNGMVTEISDDDFEVIKSDKKAFQNFLGQRDKALADNLKSEFKAEFSKLSESQKEIVLSKEFDSIAKEYGDEFVQANENKALEPYLDKGYDYETAFKLHMQDQGKVAKKAEKAGSLSSQVARKSGTIEKGGMAQVRGGPVVKAKNLNEALERAFDMARKGQKDYRFTKD